MFERFTDRARRVLVLAQDEARLMEHNFLGTEHLLLGLVKEGEGVAGKALVALGATYEGLRAKVSEVIPPGPPGNASGAPPFTPRSKAVLELALKEALEMNHNYIGTEHLLLGLVREASGVGAQVLVARGLDLTTVRAKVRELLEGLAAAQPSPMGRTTPAATVLPTRVKALAGTQVVGSHHYLLAILEDPTCLAAKVLASLGVTREAVAERIRAMGTAGTSDAMGPAGAPFEFQFGTGIKLKVSDPDLAARLALALRDAPASEPQQERLARLAASVGEVVADAVRQSFPPPEPPAGGDAAAEPEEDAAPPADE